MPLLLILSKVNKLFWFVRPSSALSSDIDECSFVNVMGECCCPDSYPSANSQVSPREQPTVSFSKETVFLSTVL